MQRKRIWILTRHYPPDVGALSYRIAHLAEVLSQDHEVTVLASQPNRYQGVPKAAKQERAGNVTIRRISSVRLMRSRGKVGRLLTELLGAGWMTLVALRHRREIDIAFSSMPPFFYALPGLATKRFGRRSLVLDVRDLWLDWAEETGLVRSHLVFRVLRWIERAAVRAADHLTVTTAGFRRILLDRYDLSPEGATVVFNGLDDALLPAQIDPPARPAGGGPLRILYAGNLGPSQNVSGLSEGLIESLSRWPQLTVTIVGDGVQRDELAAINHDRLQVLPHVDRAELAEMYRDTDAFLIHLTDLDVYRHTVPSKLFEYVAYDRPILCGVRGEAREIAFRYAECIAFEPDDPASFATAVDRLCSGAAADNAGEPRADLSEILRSSRTDQWLQVFESLQ
jgi:glycosyltransferase involved in cell wall biosynthesis